jgi:hypothetical protein
MTKEEKLQKLNSLLFCLSAHPENEPDSEFADRISDLEELIEHEKNLTTKYVWKNVEREKPLAYQTGHWDGKKSDTILIQDIQGNIFAGTYYEGFIDGNNFYDFYDDKDNEILDVAKFMEIDMF